MGIETFVEAGVETHSHPNRSSHIRLKPKDEAGAGVNTSWGKKCSVEGWRDGLVHWKSHQL